MKQISTGAGLVALAVGMVATAFIISQRSGGEAFAQQPIAQPSQTPSPEDREFLAKSKRAEADSLLSSSTTCYLDEVNWFGIPHFIPLCGENPAGVAPLYAADVNGDGRSESFFLDYGTFVNAIENGQPTGSGVCISRAVPLLDSSGNSRFQSQVVFDSKNAHSWLKQAYPWVKVAQVDAGIGRGGWLDMDSDGDLDLVLFVSLWDGVTSPPLYGEWWFENTGYQAPPPLNPYDFDGNGHVNTADLSLMLMEFTD
jgi:hypothetical protein